MKHVLKTLESKGRPSENPTENIENMFKQSQKPPLSLIGLNMMNCPAQ